MDKGWKDGIQQFDFLDIYQCGINAFLVYGEESIVLVCETDPATIRYGNEHGEVIGKYYTEEEFYNAVIFGKPIQEIVDESYFDHWS